jgi:hypothetical protein
MTVGLAGGNIRMEGVCPVEDAERLLRLVLNNRRAIVDWRSCEEAHTAVIQILLAARPELLGPAANAFLQNRIAPIIGGRRAGLHAPGG